MSNVELHGHYTELYRLIESCGGKPQPDESQRKSFSVQEVLEVAAVAANAASRAQPAITFGNYHNHSTVHVVVEDNRVENGEDVRRRAEKEKAEKEKRNAEKSQDEKDEKAKKTEVSVADMAIAAAAVGAGAVATTAYLASVSVQLRKKRAIETVWRFVEPYPDWYFRKNYHMYMACAFPSMRAVAFKAFLGFGGTASVIVGFTLGSKLQVVSGIACLASLACWKVYGMWSEDEHVEILRHNLMQSVCVAISKLNIDPR